MLTEPDAFGDESSRVIADGQVGDPLAGGDAPVEGAGALGALGRVLRDVARNLGVGQLASGRDRPGIDLAAPGERSRGEPVGSRRIDVDGAGRLSDGQAEEADGSPGGRRSERTAGAVEADDGVEADGASMLVLGDLGVGDPDVAR